MLCIGIVYGVPVEIGTEMHSIPNSMKLIDVFDNFKLDVHRT
jgi:hypothetical protein